METFIEDTIDTNFFNIKNMKYDNACFYKSFTNCISNNKELELNISRIIPKIAYE